MSIEINLFLDAISLGSAKSRGYFIMRYCQLNIVGATDWQALNIFYRETDPPHIFRKSSRKYRGASIGIELCSGAEESPKRRFFVMD